MYPWSFLKLIGGGSSVFCSSRFFIKEILVKLADIDDWRHVSLETTELDGNIHGIPRSDRWSCPSGVKEKK
jgi:hypothetical protein